MDGLTDVGAMVWRVQARPDGPEIDVEAMASRAWVVSRDPTIGLRARVGPMRVVPSEPDSGGPVRCAAEPGDGGCGERGDRRGDAALAGLAEKARVGAATAGLPTGARTIPGSRAGERHGSDHRRETMTCAAARGDLTRNGGVGRGVSKKPYQIPSKLMGNLIEGCCAQAVGNGDSFRPGCQPPPRFEAFAIRNRFSRGVFRAET